MLLLAVMFVEVKLVTDISAAKASESTPPSLIEIVLASSPSYVVPEFNCNVALSTVNAFSTDEACPVKVPTIELPVIVPLELMSPLAVTGPYKRIFFV